MATDLDAHAIPDHVPGHLVRDFHVFGDAKYIADPDARVTELRRDYPPVFWSERGGCWYVTGYEPLVEAFKDDKVFSNELAPGLPDDYVYIPYPLSLDQPKHTAYSVPLKAAFSPQSMAKLEPQIRKLAADLIDHIAPAGECEFMDAVAEPLPILMFLSIMGLPLERFSEFRTLAVEYLGTPDPAIKFEKIQIIDTLMLEYIDARRAVPQDDILSYLWSLEIDGKPITRDDMRRYGFMLFSAGLDSVTNGMGHSMHFLAQRPDLQERLKSHPEDINATTEELLRRHGVTTPPRRVARDIEFYGAPLKTGDWVELFVIAGNLDEKAFDRPAEFEMKRDRTHLTFGYGIHRCTGAHLARIELHILYQEWLKRIPSFRLDPSKPVIYDPGHILRITNLPLIWDR